MTRRPAVDEPTLRALVDDMGGDVEVVKELIQSYLEEAPRLVAEARDALAARDAATFQRAAHTLKSASATFGALPLADLARDLEQDAKAGRLPQADALAEAARLLDEVRAALLLRLD